MTIGLATARRFVAEGAHVFTTGQVALARHADSSSGEILHLRAMIDVTDTARAYLHREDDPKLCVAAHHPRVGLCCFYERILLDHRPDTGQLGEAQRIFRVGRRS